MGEQMKSSNTPVDAYGDPLDIPSRIGAHENMPVAALFSQRRGLSVVAAQPVARAIVKRAATVHKSKPPKAPKRPKAVPDIPTIAEMNRKRLSMQDLYKGATEHSISE